MMLRMAQIEQDNLDKDLDLRITEAVAAVVKTVGYLLAYGEGVQIPDDAIEAAKKAARAKVIAEHEQQISQAVPQLLSRLNQVVTVSQAQNEALALASKNLSMSIAYTARKVEQYRMGEQSPPTVKEILTLSCSDPTLDAMNGGSNIVLFNPGQK